MNDDFDYVAYNDRLVEMMDAAIAEEERKLALIQPGDALKVERGGKTWIFDIEDVKPAGSWGQSIIAKARRTT